MEFAFATDIGRHRSENEDSFYVDEIFPIIAVADGMGGHSAGKIASQMAVDLLESFCRKFTDDLFFDLTLKKIESELTKLAAQINRKIYDVSREDRDLRGMGTTLTIAVIAHQHCVYAHVGDSRIYRVRADQIEQITRDHSLVQELIDAGEIDSEFAKIHPQRNVITCAIGARSSIEIDTGIVPFEIGDKILACTDGLTSSILSDLEITEIIARSENLEVAAEDLIDYALELGGSDNITLVIGQI